jgi:AraC-like DNA-binding protein
MVNPQTISVGWMSAAIDQLVAHGINRSLLAAELGELPSETGLPNRQLQLTLARRLWHLVAELSDDPLIGLKVGAALPLQATNIVSLVMLHSPTVTDMVRNARTYQGLVSNNGFYSARTVKGGLDTVYRPEPAAVLSHPLQIDSILSVTLSLMHHAGLPDIRPEFVRVTTPDRTLQSAYETFFRCPVEMGSDEPGYVLSNKNLIRDVPHADPALLAALQAHGDALLKAQQRLDQLSFSVRTAISARGSHKVSCAEVADDLGLGVRTLQRRLSDAGTTFRHLCEEASMEEAEQLLRQTDMPVPEIAHRLGYSEPSSFSRAVFNWFGARPTALRQNISSE